MTLAGRRILLVDDESMVLMLIEDMLRDLGAETVETAMNVEEASRLADSMRVDLAVLDINLSGTRSYPVAERLKARGVPVLFATGYGSSGHEEAWIGWPTLSKPFDSASLATAIGHLLPE